MTDPFESLRHDAESIGSTAVDPRFRADLLVEVRHRLEGTTASSVRERVTADTPIPMEAVLMKADRTKQSRPFLLVASCIALVAGGVATVVALQGDDDASPATTDTVTTAPNPSAIQPLETSTTAHTATVPATTPTTAADSTTPPPEPSTQDLAIAGASLIPAETFGTGWMEMPETSNYMPVSFGPDSSSSTQCDPFVGTVFEPMRSAAVDQDVFLSPPPHSEVVQHWVAVLPNEATARSVLRGFTDPEFSDCAMTSARMLRATRFASPTVSPVEVPVDELAFYRFSLNTIDAEPRQLAAALMRIGRTITYVDVLQVGSDGTVMTTDGQFAAILRVAASAVEAASA